MTLIKRHVDHVFVEAAPMAGHLGPKPDVGATCALYGPTGHPLARRAPPAAPERIIAWEEEVPLRGANEIIPVWIDVRKLEALLPLSQLMEHVGFAWEGGIPGKYDRFDKFVRCIRTTKVSLPWASIEPANAKHPGRNIVHLHNGRHRFAWMRDHSALALPVAVSLDEAPEVARLVGTKVSLCRVTMNKIPEWQPPRRSVH